MERLIFKDKDVIFVVTHHVKEAIVLALDNLLALIKERPNTLLVVLDSAAGEPIRAYLRTLKHERVIVQYFERNLGKAHAVNQFISENITEENLPRSIWSIDPDILFDRVGFDYLQEAVLAISKVGMLSMRYKKNNCNPENNLYLPSKNVTGSNGKIYNVISPFLANVAGGIFAVPGSLLKDPLGFRLFPIKYERAYGPDEVSLYYYLKRRGYKNCYLNGTLATHLRSGQKVAEELCRQ